MFYLKSKIISKKRVLHFSTAFSTAKAPEKPIATRFSTVFEKVFHILWKTHARFPQKNVSLRWH